MMKQCNVLALPNFTGGQDDRQKKTRRRKDRKTENQKDRKTETNKMTDKIKKQKNKKTRRRKDSKTERQKQIR